MSENDDFNSEEFLNPKIPKAGDSSFVEQGRAVAYFSPGDCESTYAICYKKAGDILVGQAKADSMVVDFLGYPTVFLYRHYLELSLKDFCNRLGEKPKLNHGLIPLWRVIRDYFDETKSDPDFDAVESVIKEWERYDRGSFSFRYPTKKSGERSLPDDFSAVGLENLCTQIQKLDNFFGGIDVYLSERDP
ncbi:MAG: hypothetical protein ACPG4T_09605 [Nannocystaceae bacterium]